MGIAQAHTGAIGCIGLMNVLCMATLPYNVYEYSNSIHEYISLSCTCTVPEWDNSMYGYTSPSSCNVYECGNSTATGLKLGQ